MAGGVAAGRLPRSPPTTTGNSIVGVATATKELSPRRRRARDRHTQRARMEIRGSASRPLNRVITTANVESLSLRFAADPPNDPAGLNSNSYCRVIAVYDKHCGSSRVQGVEREPRHCADGGHLLGADPIPEQTRPGKHLSIGNALTGAIPGSVPQYGTTGSAETARSRQTGYPAPKMIWNSATSFRSTSPS